MERQIGDPTQELHTIEQRGQSTSQEPEGLQEGHHYPLSQDELNLVFVSFKRLFHIISD